MKRTRNIYHYQYRKCKKAEEQIRKNKLLSACIGEGGDLFQELKAFRKSTPVVATSMDGVTENIPDHFRSIYSQLYNSADDTEKIEIVTAQVETMVNSSQLEQVSRITPSILGSCL